MNAGREPVMLNWFQHLNQPIHIPNQVQHDSRFGTNVKAQMSKLSAVMLNLFQHLFQPSPIEIPNQVRDDSCSNVNAQMSKLSAVILNLFQHLITIEDELRGFIPLWRGDQGVCYLKGREQTQLLRTHPSPTKVELPLQGGDFMNARREPVMLNLFPHLNQPSPTGEIPKQVRDDSHCRTNFKAQISKLTLSSGRR